MGKVHFLKPRKPAAAHCEQTSHFCAEIIFFPGVRYEPLVDGKPCQRGIGRRFALAPAKALQHRC